MAKYLKVLLPFMILIAAACSGSHLIKDKDYLGLIDQSFDKRKQLCIHREKELFSVFSHDLSVSQAEALKFLYAFMPLSDLADYNGEFFLGNVNVALRTRSETPWGSKIPDYIFLHYVLPCRVNNENLDSFRIIYHDELVQRVRGMDLADAALEINHWCHEKVTYQAADSRTSAPLSTILSARGRCGEESTLTVAALRAAGIPARQVYTPRWAHTDDNHAWVEIWSDSHWHYLGACEPEPVLDRGWFTEPARRAMLVHTKSFGAPFGEENAINKFGNYSDINNLARYAVTKTIFVRVTGRNGLPVKNADVEYQLYNYAEFYPLAVVKTDEEGISRFETGLGDLLVWAHYNDDFDFRKVSVIDTDTLNLKLNKDAGRNYSLNLDLAVPVTRVPYSAIPVNLVKKNSERISLENNIRRKYIDSWIKPNEAKAFAEKLKIDSSRIKSILSRSMGNYKEIRSFLSETPDSLRDLALSLLEILADKDLRDTRKGMLSDHLKYSALYQGKSAGGNYELYRDYVLNPRIANEIIVSWRSYFREKLPSGLLSEAPSDPSLVIRYLNDSIQIAEDENYYKTPISPIGVNELKVSDSFSRSVCFVAICRSLGIPARLEPGSNVPQYFFKDGWNDVFFSGENKPELQKGYLKLISSDTKPVPEYHIHFTLARFESGRYNTLEYDYNRKITDFTDELALSPGQYMMVTGNRLNDSRILSEISFFNLSANEHKTLEVKLRQDLSASPLLGKVNINDVTGLFKMQNLSSQECTKNGYVIIWIEPEKEPTKHIFNDLPLLKGELDRWGGKLLFLSDNPQDSGSFKPENVKNLPVNSFFGTDVGLRLLNGIMSANKLAAGNMPYVIQCDNNDNIVFTSSGYRIGIGEQILKHTK